MTSVNIAAQSSNHFPLCWKQNDGDTIHFLALSVLFDAIFGQTVFFILSPLFPTSTLQPKVVWRLEEVTIQKGRLEMTNSGALNGDF